MKPDPISDLYHYLKELPNIRLWTDGLEGSSYTIEYDPQTLKLAEPDNAPFFELATVKVPREEYEYYLALRMAEWGYILTRPQLTLIKKMDQGYYYSKIIAHDNLLDKTIPKQPHSSDFYHILESYIELDIVKRDQRRRR